MRTKTTHPIPAAALPMTTPTVEGKAREMIAWLRAHRDPKRAVGVQQYFKHEVVSLGMATPVLRAYAAAQAKPLTAVWDLAQSSALCGRLLEEPELEIRGTGILVLGAFRREFRPVLTRAARRWLETRLDNWALVDSFCGSVLSPLLAQYSAVEKTLRQWSRARGLWVRRAAMVTLVPFARRGQLLDTAYDLAREHFHQVLTRRAAQGEDLMHKAVGWLLREAGKTDPERLRDFLKQHGPAIPRTTVRYAIERFPVAERLRLLEATRRLAPSD